jgi:imidazolonepropionase-like amidohydrolase
VIALKGGTFITVTGNKLNDGAIIFDEDKIIGLSKKGEALPQKASIIDTSGKYITPGLIDAHTHIGICEEGVGEDLYDENETTNPSTPHLRVIDAINPGDSAFQDAIIAGVTTVQVLPGSANVFGGEGSVLKVYGETVEDMLITECSGVKVAFGENPRKVYGSEQKKNPRTRMAIAALIRENLVEAKNYIKRQEKNSDENRDLKNESLAKLLTGEVVMRAHAHRADDIATVLRIAKEFNLKFTIEHCTEGQKLSGLLAEMQVPVALGPNLSSKSKIELRDMTWQNVTNLAAAGVPFTIITDHPVVPIQYLNVCAALTVREGLAESEAFAAITINAARHIGLEDRIGSLESGKDADIVIWSGHPFDYRSRVEKTFINGKLVYDSTW